MATTPLCRWSFQTTFRVRVMHGDQHREGGGSPGNPGICYAACPALPAPEVCGCPWSAAPSPSPSALPAHSGAPALTRSSAAHVPVGRPEPQPLLPPAISRPSLELCTVSCALSSIMHTFAACRFCRACRMIYHRLKRMQLMQVAILKQQELVSWQHSNLMDCAKMEQYL